MDPLEWSCKYWSLLIKCLVCVILLSMMTIATPLSAEFFDGLEFFHCDVGFGRGQLYLSKWLVSALSSSSSPGGSLVHASSMAAM